MNYTWRQAGLLAVLYLASVAANAFPLDTPSSTSALPATWQPPAPLVQVPLWPQGHAIARPPVTGPESVKTGAIIENVTRPTMTVVPPKGANTGTTVVVFPGGGFRVVAMEGEGTEVCDWLTSKGITCVLLKYRVPTSGPQWDGSCNCRREPTVHMALQDAQRAIRLLRQEASDLHIDPHKIGVIGFSAGGNMVADVSNAGEHSYASVDDADRLSARPDFAMALYPGRLWEGKGVVLNPTLHVTAKTPPTFLVQAEDDPVDDVRNSITYYLALKQSGIPVEMHLYATGGHAFGLRKKDQPIGVWPELAEKWMKSISMLPHG
ncbi:alpha/beta hydrolase [Pinirhizobacter sp.]|jgi:acetyl esterase/lipase|uniref:alpha/beta hydrolase n=1 Tax=Pinirhizobacter sp. TaxID=2950432 RepID=UPI002F3F5FE8